MSEERSRCCPFPAQRPIQLPANASGWFRYGAGLEPVRRIRRYGGHYQRRGNVRRPSKGVRVRFANSIQFADILHAQTLLIGAITNRWTMELEQSWRFQFARRQDQKTVIVDTMKQTVRRPPPATLREWAYQTNEDGSAQKDYTLISRISNSSSRELVIVAAGVKQFGTEAAGRLLTDPEQFGAMLRKLPGKWESKNVQFVLETRVIGNTPAEPEVVAWHVW